MPIVSTAITPCTQGLHDAQWKFARAKVPQLQGWILSLTDDDGNVGRAYAHAIPAISTHGDGARSALEFITPSLVGRDATDIASIMETVDVQLAFQPSVKAAVDMALHDLLARRLGVPIYVLLGGKLRDSVPQSRILPIKTPSEMAAIAARLAEEGYGQLKLKLAGDTSLDVQRIAAVRDAVGDGVVLTLDPNQSYHAKQMISAFSKMERYDIALIEQPVPQRDWAGLKLVTDTLPVAVEADESAQTLDDVYRLVTDRVADVINLKVTKLGGFRRFMDAARICDAGGVGCRMGAAFGPALMQSASLQAAVALRALPYACELSEHQHLKDDPFTPLPVVKGVIHLPDGPGCGVTFAGQTSS